LLVDFVELFEEFRVIELFVEVFGGWQEHDAKIVGGIKVLFDKLPSILPAPSLEFIS
jgi:hypothetical protein